MEQQEQKMEQQVTEPAKKASTKKSTTKTTKKEKSGGDAGEAAGSSGSQTTTTTTTTTTKESSKLESSKQGGSSEFVTGTRGPFTSMKTIVINRTSGDAVDGFSSQRSVQTYSSSSSMAASASLHQSVQEMNSMLSGRQKEKKQMRELNERFASYIEKVRFLEAQNRSQAEELRKLRDSWGKETERIKKMYQVELDQLRRLLEDADKYKAEAEVRIASMEEQLNELQLLLDEANRQHQADRELVEKLSTQMAEYDGEISLLRRRAAAFDEEKARDKAEIKRLRQDVSRLRLDLDNETLQHINAENRAQSLREELEFLRTVHESELKELSALAYRDTTQENREFWKNEMAQALHDIQQEFDSKMDAVRSEVESQYSIRVQEAKTSSTRDNMELAHLKEENKRIKSQISDSRGRLPELEARNAQLERELEELRREMEEAQRDCEMQKNQLRADLASSNATLEEYLRELQSLMDAKLSLELEIAAYRKLLEGEETRIEQSTSSVRQSSSSITRQQVTVTEQTSSSSSGGGQQVIVTEKSGGGSGGEQVTVTETKRIVSGGGGSAEESSAMQQSSSSSAEQSREVEIKKSTMSARTSYERSQKGSVKIDEVAEDGSFIVLENTGKRREKIGNWQLERNVDDGENVVIYILPEGTELNTSDQKTIKIWAKGSRPEDSNDLEAEDFDSWGIGKDVVTKLLNEEGDERATHTQRTTYTAE